MARATKAKTSGKGSDTGVTTSSREQLLKYYTDMLLIRRFEERAGQLYGMGLIGGFCHLYIGQEAIAVGMEAIRVKGDQIITGYRDHGHMLAAGMDAREVMAELTGRAGGSSKGKGGSMHMFSTEAGFYGGHGIVGAQVSLGTGLALANKYQQNGNVAFAAAAYNAGEGALAKWTNRDDALLFMATIPYNETRDYVERALYNLAAYRLRLAQVPAELQDLSQGRWPIYRPQDR